MNGPLVSIVTPSYNQAAYLESTIQSVLQQEYAPLEYLVVDGGSTDGSVEIIERYADQLAWWVSEKDRGQADAINKGFRRARGEIVAWVNSDDLYLPGAVKEAVAVLEENPRVGMVYGNAVSADAEGVLLNHLRFAEWDLKDLLRFRMICQPAVFMRRAVLEEVHFLDPSYHFLLDHNLWIRIARRSEILHCERAWAVSRYHPEAKNITMAEVCGQEAYRILEWAREEADMAPILERHRAEIEGGAHQLNARYLLDGGKAGPALRAYLQAAAAYPPLLKESWHRVLFAALSVLGGGFLGKWYYRWKRGQRPDLSGERSLRDWPGLDKNFENQDHL